MSSRTVLCHLQDWQWIPVEECLSLQNKKAAKECFGCNACSRLCANCRRKKPVCPALDLCKKCLEEALSNEGFLAEDAFRQEFSWRRCDGCRKRLVYRSSYGLCLHCSVREFLGSQAPKSLGNGHVLTLQETTSEDEPPENGDLSKQISGLSDIEQIVVMLHCRDAYQMGKIGEILGLSERAVLGIYSQSLQKIKDSPNQERTSP